MREFAAAVEARARRGAGSAHMEEEPMRAAFATALILLALSTGVIAMSSVRRLRKAPDARAAAAARPRRIIYNDDGCAVWGPGNRINDTAESYLAQRLANVLDSQVDTVFFNTVMWADRFSHVPRVGEFVTESMVAADAPMMKNLCVGFQKLADSGADALQLSLDFCRKHKIEFFWTYRINDAHDVFEIRQVARFKRENPHLTLGRPEDTAFPGTDQRHYWSAYDFTHAAVRERRLAVIQDVLDHYDVDGIDLDFFRFPLFFPSVMEGKPATRRECDLMTGLVREVRARLLAASEKRGRPLLLSVRVPGTLQLAQAIGLEVDTWLKQGLVDLLVISGGYMPLTLPAAELCRLARRHEVPAYVCISASGLKQTHSEPDAWYAAAANAFAAGADGVMTFNHFPGKPNRILAAIGDPKTLRWQDKMFGVDWAVPGGYANHVVPQAGTLPLSLEPGVDAATVPFPVSDDLAAAARAGRLAGVELRLRIPALDGAPVQLRLNGHTLRGVRTETDWLICEPPHALVRKGRNRLGVTVLQGTAPEATARQLTDVQFRVRYRRRD